MGMALSSNAQSRFESLLITIMFFLALLGSGPGSLEDHALHLAVPSPEYLSGAISQPLCF